MASLTLDRLNARYRAHQVLHDLSVTLTDGEFFVLLGPSGAGKTTTLRCVAGLLDGVDGVVRIGDRDMTGVEPYERNVAMAFESYALYPQKTVRENLASPLRSGRPVTWSATARAERVAEVAETLGIDRLLDRYPRELSNGQRQRTALGRVLVRPADVYLLDEPLSHLDARLRAVMRTELKQLSDMSRTTTLYVTHDYQEALALGDRVGVLREGRLVQVGTPDELWHRPYDTFVAASLGQPEMNLLAARHLPGGRVTAAGGALTVALPPPGDGPTEPADAPRNHPDGQDTDVVVGVRPRDLAITPSGGGPRGSGGPPSGGGPPDALEFAGRVVLAERLGRSVELSVAVGDDTVIAVSDDPAVREGDTVRLAVDWQRVHVFLRRADQPYPVRAGTARPPRAPADRPPPGAPDQGTPPAHDTHRETDR